MRAGHIIAAASIVVTGLLFSSQAYGSADPVPTPSPVLTYPGASTPDATLISCPSGEVCGVAGMDGNGDAMNNWNNMKTNIYGYLQGKSNEQFSSQNLNRCSGSDRVTSTCPFTNHSRDTALLGKRIIQIAYSTGSCVGDNVSTGLDALFEACNNPSTGTGGGINTVYVIAGNNSLVSLGCTNNSANWCQISLTGTSSPVEFGEWGNPTQWANV